MMTTLLLALLSVGLSVVLRSATTDLIIGFLIASCFVFGFVVYHGIGHREAG